MPDGAWHICQAERWETQSRRMIHELMQARTEEEMVKSTICLELTEAEVQEKKSAWTEMGEDIFLRLR